jgi:hypothetical protein
MGHRGRKRKPGKREPSGKLDVVRRPELLPEDRIMHQQSAVPKRRQRRERGPLAIETGAFGRREVEERILRGMKTLRALPDHERRFFLVKSGYPDFLQDHMDAYASVEAGVPRFRPTPMDVSDYLRALSWVRHLSREKWQLIWWRSFDFSFGLMAKYRGQSDETTRRHYREAVTDAWIAANGMARAA